MKAKYTILIVLAALVSITLACSTIAAPPLVTVTPIRSETPYTIDLPIQTIDDFRTAVGTWSAIETDDYVVGVLSLPLPVEYDGRDSLFLALAIYRKNSQVDVFPPLLIGEYGGQTLLTLANGHAYHPALVQTSTCWPHYADMEMIWQHFNRMARCGPDAWDPGVPGLVSLGWTFQLDEGETGQVAQIDFHLSDPGVMFFTTIP